MSRFIIKAPYITMDNENVKNIGAPPKKQNKPEKVETEVQSVNIDSKEDNKELIIAEAKAFAANIIKNAKADASKIIDDAKKQACVSAEADSQKIKKQAQDDGYKQGYDEGVKKSNKLISDANTVLANAKKEKEQAVKNLEPQIVDLVVKIIDKLISDIIEINPKVIIGLIKNGLDQVTVTGNINLHVSPSDYDFVLENKQDVYSFIDGSVNLEIIKDFAINKGDCIIETPLGNIDSSLGYQLDALKQDLYIILKNR